MTAVVLGGVGLACAAAVPSVFARTQAVTLTAVKSGPATATVGAGVTYTVGVTANGGDATGVVLTEFAPANLSLTGASVPGGSCFGDALSRQCNVGSIVSGTTLTFTIDGTATGVGTIANQASVTAGNAPTVTSNTFNTTVTTGSGPPPPGVPVVPIIPIVNQSADVYVQLAGPSLLNVGDRFPGYEITVGNNGPVTAIAPEVTLSGSWVTSSYFSAPALSIIPTGIVCQHVEQYVYGCTLPDLEKGQSLTIHATLKSGAGYNPDVTGDFDLRAAAWASNPDPYEPNNYAPSYGKAFRTTFQLLPVTAEVLPREGAPGTAVAITGSGLDAVTGVHFNGTPAMIGARSSGMIDTTVPPGATTGELTLALADGTTDDAGLFTVTAPRIVHCPAGMSCTGGMGNHELFCTGGGTCTGGMDTTMLHCGAGSSCLGGPAVVQESCSGHSECESTGMLTRLECNASSVCLPWGGARQVMCTGGSVCRVAGPDAHAECRGGSYCTGAPGATLMCSGSICAQGGSVAGCGRGSCSLSGRMLTCTSGSCNFATRDGMRETVSCSGGHAMVDADPGDVVHDCMRDTHPPVNVDDAQVSLAEAISREELAISPDDIASPELRKKDLGKALEALHGAQAEIEKSLAGGLNQNFYLVGAKFDLASAIKNDEAALVRRARGLVRSHVDEALLEKRTAAGQLAKAAVDITGP